MTIPGALLAFMVGVLIGLVFQLVFIYWADEKIDEYTDILNIYIRLPFHIIGAAISWAACLGTTSFYISWNIKNTDYYIVFEEIM